MCYNLCCSYPRESQESLTVKNLVTLVPGGSVLLRKGITQKWTLYIDISTFGLSDTQKYNFRFVIKIEILVTIWDLLSQKLSNEMGDHLEMATDHL